MFKQTSVQTKKKIILHLISEEYSKKSLFVADLASIQTFSEEMTIYNVFFYKSSNTPPILLNSKYIEVRNYEDEKELIEKIQKITQKDEVLFLNVSEDSLLELGNKLRLSIGQVVSDTPNLFNDKSIQRNLLKEKAFDTSVDFLKFKIGSIKFKEIEEKLGTPFVLKVLNGKSGAGVVKIKNEKQFDKYIENYSNIIKKLELKGLKNTDEILAEEYINGDSYSIDYYVNEKGIVFMARPIKVISGDDIGFDDYFVVCNIISEDFEKEYNLKEIKKFIEKTVDAMGIKNTFVHHEYKINKKGQYKTMEVNGRIGGRKISLYDTAYESNILGLVLCKDINFKIKTNVCYSKIWATKEGTLKGLDKKFEEKITKLDSYVRIRYNSNIIGKQVGFSSDGYDSIASIEFVNENTSKLQKDIKFIEENYSDMLEID